MNICILAKDASLNGGNRVVAGLAHGLEKVGHSVFVSISNGPIDFSWTGREILGVTVSEVLEQKFDCVVSSYFSECNPLSQIHSRLKIRYVQANYWKDGQESEARIREANEYFLASEAENVVVSSYLQDCLAFRGLSSSIIRPSIDQSAFLCTREYCDGKFRVLVEGTANRWKYLGESRSSIPDKYEVWCFSSQRVSIEVDKRWVLPSRKQLSMIMSACDVLVKLSAMEGHPLTVLEAMKCGVIPIVMNEGGQLDYCEHGVNSFMVESPEEVAGVLNHISKLSKFELSRLKHNAVQTAERRTWNHVASEFSDFISGMLYEQR